MIGLFGFLTFIVTLGIGDLVANGRLAARMLAVFVWLVLVAVTVVMWLVQEGRL